MIRHCVMLKLKPDASTARLNKVMHGLAELVDTLDGCSGFCAGPNRDYENKSPDYRYGFTLDARNPKALAAYAVDSEHLALGAKLVEMCVGGADGIVVYDIDTRR